MPVASELAGSGPPPVETSDLAVSPPPNPYRRLGAGLCLGGAIYGAAAYLLLNSPPLAAIGMSAVLLGAVSFALAFSRPQVSGEAARLMLQAGTQNISALLEELNLTTPAVYLPARLAGGQAKALIPLQEISEGRELARLIPARLIVRYGPGEAEMALAVTTLGSLCLESLENKPKPGEVTQALSYLLVGKLDIARGVHCWREGNTVQVDIRGARWQERSTRYTHCLGSLAATVAASVLSEAVGQPVRIKAETREADMAAVTLEILR